jgi:plasmid stabilization system protein ParE
MSLLVRPEARHDILSAMNWYETRELGLGAQFLAEVDAVFERIVKRPESYAKTHGPFRRALMRRFPFATYFKSQDDNLIVFAVLHQRLDRGVLDRRS